MLDDGSVSVGLLDKTFQVPALGSQVEIGGVVYRQAIDLKAAHGNVAISNPHFTFHPAAYYHLRANGEAELFSGLLMVDLVVQSEGVLPWIRVVSNPVTNLKRFQGAPEGRAIEVIRLQVPSEEHSVSLEVDFVNAETKDAASPKDLFMDWHGRTIRVRAFHVEAQGATLWWNHSS
ncbi:hypothetical protein [Sulfurisoma sediminicola]|uniref:hypothetical protein n=1 Tax=Sulfurisoma sediminicola TaxID=1381557 RepID=UPI0014042A23|nr:hypothetical protein [Sulfurisoma sediminicola]